MIEKRRVDLKKFELNNSSILTVVIPIRGMHNRDISDRIAFCLRDNLLDRSKVDFLVVDDGSDKKNSQIFFEKCQELSINYIYLDTKLMPFSIARARNIGAMYSKSEYIMFMDVDLYPYDGFYNDLLNEIKIQQIEKYCNDFIMVGVIYLTKDKGIELFFDTPSEQRKNTMIQKLLENDTEYFEKFSTGTSVNLYNRMVYLVRGGNDEDFEEWGYDDLEFNLRMIRESRKFPYPSDMHLDLKNFRTINEYRGWKSIYRLFGDITFQKGIILFHIWHEIDHKSDYMKGKERNRKLFEQKYQAFSRNGDEPDPLPDVSAGKTLLFSQTNPFVYNRKILPYLGVVCCENEEKFDDMSLIEYIETNSIDRVLMFNPYGSEHRLALYKALRQANIAVIIAERGALRDSVFYDWNGFNAESISYKSEFWDKPLTPEDYRRVDDYIRIETAIAISLEKQTSLIGAVKLRQKLGIHLDKKVLFVPMQRPSDSVIKYFCGPIGTYDNFIALVQETIETLDSGWRVVVKKHPLEDDIAAFEGAISTDANIKDLLEMADAVLLINSGVGVLSMLWNKPVYYCGDVFYCDDRINRQVKNSQELLAYLADNFLPDKETVYRFLNYLLNDFYSFGHFTTRETNWTEGGRMTVTTGIDYYQVRNVSSKHLNFYTGTDRRISRESILFDKYATIAVHKLNATASSNKQTAIEPKKSHSMRKKMKKFRESPSRFFKESKNPFLRLIGKRL